MKSHAKSENKRKGIGSKPGDNTICKRLETNQNQLLQEPGRGNSSSFSDIPEKGIEIPLCKDANSTGPSSDQGHPFNYGFMVMLNKDFIVRLKNHWQQDSALDTQPGLSAPNPQLLKPGGRTDDVDSPRVERFTGLAYSMARDFVDQYPRKRLEELFAITDPIECLDFVREDFFQFINLQPRSTEHAGSVFFRPFIIRSG